MDSEQWRSQQLSDHHQHSAKVSKLQLVDQQLPASGLALFAPDPNSNFNKTSAVNTSLSPFPDSAPTIFPRMGYFSLAQWQELELQALIYKYMLAGAPVPMELILPIRKSLLSGLPYCHHPQQYQHFQPAMLRAGYWGRCVIDPEPGRCRRTDGKKWRCSREVVPGQKYCERHVHRGRNRSRKHVEIPTPTAGSGLKTTFTSPLMNDKETHFTLSGSSSTLDILSLNQRPIDAKPLNGCVQQSYASKLTPQGFQDDKSDGRVLRRFFDDWPRSKQETLAATNNNANSATSTTNLSISIPGNSSSDFSLKLSTGNSDHKTGPGTNVDIGNEAVQQPPPASWAGWGSHGEASMGGPLAEALRSSTSTPSPRSILQKPNGSVSEASSISI